MKRLTLNRLCQAAKKFSAQESEASHPSLFGVTDGKAIGTYIEHRFQSFLADQFIYERGSSAKGIDLPGSDINTDIKVTSARQPQSSCPYRDSKQKIYGLGYNLLIFVYEMTDAPADQNCLLKITDCTFLDSSRTADYTTTYRLIEMLKDGANREDILAYLIDKNVPGDDITLNQLANMILNKTPLQGYLTISNALQWRLQYARVVNLKDDVSGIKRLV
ncbi:MAG: restriction endonuclease [Bacteroidota bacterium]